MVSSSVQIKQEGPRHPEVKTVLWDVRAGLLFLSVQQKYLGYSPTRMRLINQLEHYIEKILSGKNLDGVYRLLKQI